MIRYDNFYRDLTATTCFSADDHVHNSQHCCDQVGRWNEVKRYYEGSEDRDPVCSVNARVYLHVCQIGGMNEQSRLLA